MGLPVTTAMVGLDICTPPNVCKLPPLAIPTPLPSMGMSPMTIPGTNSLLVFTGGCPTSVMGSMGMTMPVDLAGVMLGNTGTVMGPFITTLGSCCVFSSCLPTATLTSLQSMNTCNTIGMTVAPSQVFVFAAP